MKRKLAILSVSCAALFAFGGVAAGNAFALEFTAPGVGYTSTSGPGVLAIPGLSEVKCKKDTNVGNTGNGVTGSVTVTFEECESPLLGGCTNVAGTNNIKTNLLTTNLVWINEATGKFGIVFSAPGNVVEFECGGIKLIVTGTARGTVTNPPLNTPTKTFTVVVSPAEGGQALETEVVGIGKFASTEETTDVATLNGGAEGEFVK